MTSIEHLSGCLLCGAELHYAATAHEERCVFCATPGLTHAVCAAGHFVCDRCHSLGALDLIEQSCLMAQECEPLRLAERLMHHPAIKMHGPEHHFLVAAVLISCYRRLHGSAERLAADLHSARQRAAEVKGGICGLHGSCGAAIGAGIATSVLTGATPLSKDEWRLANLMTATCLTTIAEAGGPRCCKRDVFLALQRAVPFLNQHLHAGLEVAAGVHCAFFAGNRECLAADCPFFPASVLR